uniref:Uncharacterized protein n=1 Tax=Populus trichocarpa TaxID=3694 RepID=A0A3N7F0C1_POPTR
MGPHSPPTRTARKSPTLRLPPSAFRPPSTPDPTTHFTGPKGQPPPPPPPMKSYASFAHPHIGSLSLQRPSSLLHQNSTVSQNFTQISPHVTSPQTFLA